MTGFVCDGVCVIGSFGCSRVFWVCAAGSFGCSAGRGLCVDFEPVWDRICVAGFVRFVLCV